MSFSMYTGSAARQNCEAGLVSSGVSVSAHVLWIVGAAANAQPEQTAANISTLREPLIQVFLHKGIVLQMWICLAHTLNFPSLTGRETFPRIEAPAAFEEPLPAQNFVDSGNTSMKVVSWVENRRIGVGQLFRQS